jgi:hypothetical protein
LTANRELAEQRGISEEDILEIDRIHALIDKFTRAWVKEPFSQGRKDKIHAMEYLLQRLWGLPQDCGYHRYAREYEFKCQWVGCTFKCTDTGVEFTIPYDVQERDYFQIGNGAIDVGRLNSYSRRIGNIIEISNEEQEIN